MTENRLHKRIGQLASFTYQKRWVVNGTADEFVLLDELIETTIYEAKRQATHPTTRGHYSDQEREAFVRFHARVDALYGLIPWRDTNVSIAEIVERNETMQQIRDAANECLTVLGVSFTDDELMND